MQTKTLYDGALCYNEPEILFREKKIRPFMVDSHSEGLSPQKTLFFVSTSSELFQTVLLFY